MNKENEPAIFTTGLGPDLKKTQIMDQSLISNYNLLYSVLALLSQNKYIKTRFIPVVSGDKRSPKVRPKHSTKCWSSRAIA